MTDALKSLSERGRGRYRAARREGLTHEQALAAGATRIGRPPSSSLLDLPLDQDEAAKLALEENPDGMRLDAIAELYGVSDELIRLIEQKALKRLACALQRAA